MSNLEKKFMSTVDRVKNDESDFSPSNDQKLQIYALYKQATEGDNQGKKPGMMDVVGRAKYNARKDLAGITQEEAMQSYIDAVDSILSS